MPGGKYHPGGITFKSARAASQLKEAAVCQQESSRKNLARAAAQHDEDQKRKLTSSVYYL
jgi:hypothetical protein